MITITEAPPKKCSGLTSLHVIFDFNIEIVNVLKQADKYFYDKKTHEWEIPCSCLSYLLDNLTYIDDITLKLNVNEVSNEYLVPKLADSYKIKPFEHQLQAVEYFLNHPCGLLLDEPGLGKTASIIHLAEELQFQKNLQHCLIICGINSLKSNWESEIKKHSNLTCRILGKKINSKGNVTYASIKERAAEIMQPLDAFFLITNIESLRATEVVDALRTTNNKFDLVVLDECHAANNSQSQQGKGLLKLSNIMRKIGLTGTLLTSSPLNAYTPLKWLGVEKSTLTNFKSQYCLFGGYGGHQIVGYKNIGMLKEELESCSLRRTKDIIKDLPPKVVINEKVEMDETHRLFYENVKKGVKEDCDKITLNTQNVLALTTRLMQATACPSILTSQPIMSSKVTRAIELTKELVSNNNKVVIMCTFKEPLNELYEILKEYNPLLFTGDVPDAQFEKNIELFQTDSKYKVALGTVSKAGTGLTLNAASYMICLNSPWNASNQQQCEDRIHRINNTKTAFVYRLICENTIDERVADIIEMKQAISDYMIDNKISEQSIEMLKSYIDTI